MFWKSVSNELCSLNRSNIYNDKGFNKGFNLGMPGKILLEQNRKVIKCKYYDKSSLKLKLKKKKQ